MRQKEEINVSELIKRFTDMKERGSLLSGPNVTSDDILSQIIGTIIKESMTEDTDDSQFSMYDTSFKFSDLNELETKPMPSILIDHLKAEYSKRFRKSLKDTDNIEDDDFLKYHQNISKEYILVKVMVEEVTIDSLLNGPFHKIRFNTKSKEGRKYGEIEYDVNKAFNKYEDCVADPTSNIYIICKFIDIEKIVVYDGYGAKKDVYINAYPLYNSDYIRYPYITAKMDDVFAMPSYPFGDDTLAPYLNNLNIN